MNGRFEHRFEWQGRSSDPNDETFGDVVEATTIDDADTFDTVLVGEPYDEAVIGRRGAREGPGALREALATAKTHHFDAGPVRLIGDLGDVILDEEGVIDDGERGDECDVAGLIQARVTDIVRAVHRLDALPVFLGGDNSMTVANVVPLIDDRATGVVNLDAHLDVREPTDGITSGTPYHQLLDADLDAYACVGARHFETSTRYHDALRKFGGAVITAEEVGDDPVAAVDRALATMDEVEAVYVSLDLDVLDANAAPGVSAPTPGGLTTRELFRVLRLLAADERLAGFEVVECAPPLDAGGRTSVAGARAVAHVLAGWRSTTDRTEVER